MTGDGRRRLGLLSATALVVANMVGGGVFTISGYSLGALGSREVVLLAWLVGGALATLGALSYGALAVRFPSSGGEYEFLRRTVSPLAGFLAGWLSLLVGFTAPIAFAGAALQRYLEPLLGLEPGGDWIGSAAIVAAAAIHGVGVRAGARVQDAVVLLKVGLIVGVIAVGAVALGGKGSPAAPPAPGFSPGAFAVSLMFVYLAYSGWNAAVYVGGEVRDPRRNLPRSLLLGTGLVTLLYLGLNAVFVYAAPVEALVDRPEVGLIAARALGGDAFGRAVGGLVVLALFTSITAMVMAGPRVYARMAEDGVFPAMFSLRDGPPRAAIALQAALALAILWTSTFDGLIAYIGYTLGLSTAATVGGLLLVRRREGAAAVPIPGYPLVPWLYVAASVAIAALGFAQRPLEASLGLATLALGVPLYWLVRRA